jgi:hypothetical protein
MPVNKLPSFGNIPVGGLVALADTSLTTVFTAGVDGAIVEAIEISSTATNIVELQLFIGNGVTDAVAGLIQVAAGTGSLAAARFPLNPLSLGGVFERWVAKDGAGNSYLNMPAGWTIKAQCGTTPTAGVVNVVVIGATYTTP